MPTPTAYANQNSAIKPMNGTVPGVTWQQFMNAFQLPNDNTTATVGGVTIPGIDGQIGAYRTQNAGTVLGGDGVGLGVGDGPTYGGFSQYFQPVGDGTQNVFTQNPDGSVNSQNVTQNDDSWWDSTGIPIVASLITGGAAGLASSVGVGVSGVGSGLANVGAGALGADGTSAAFGGAGAAGGAAGGSISPLASVGNDIGSAGYNPYNPANWTADSGQVATDGTVAGPGATTGSNDLLSSFQDLAKQYGFGNGPIGSVQNIVNGTGQVGDYLSAGSNLNTLGGLASDLGGSGGSTTDIPGVSTSYGGGPSGNGLSYSDAANSAYNNTPYSGSANDGAPVTNSGGSSTLGTSTIGRLISGDGTVSDYASLLGTGASALLGYNAANSAANVQSNAANQANALAQQIFAQNTANNAPYIASGASSLNKQSNLLGLNGTGAQTQAFNDFQASPNYQFALTQGLKGVQNSAAASGGLFSGRAAKDLNNYAQGQASQNYDTYYGDLSGVSNLGQAAAAGQAANGNNFSATYGNNLTSGAAAQAAGTVGGTNAITSSLGTLINQNNSNQLLQLLLKNSGATSNGIYGG